MVQHQVRSTVWQCGNIADIATALMLSNDDPMYRAGVLALCRALNAQPEIPSPRLTVTVELIEAQT